MSVTLHTRLHRNRLTQTLHVSQSPVRLSCYGEEPSRQADPAAENLAAEV